MNHVKGLLKFKKSFGSKQQIGALGEPGGGDQGRSGRGRRDPADL